MLDYKSHHFCHKSALKNHMKQLKIQINSTDNELKHIFICKQQTLLFLPGLHVCVCVCVCPDLIWLLLRIKYAQLSLGQINRNQVKSSIGVQNYYVRGNDGVNKGRHTRQCGFTQCVCVFISAAFTPSLPDLLSLSHTHTHTHTRSTDPFVIKLRRQQAKCKECEKAQVLHSGRRSCWALQTDVQETRVCKNDKALAGPYHSALKLNIW